MIDQEKLTNITHFLAEKVFRDMNIMLSWDIPPVELEKSYIDEDGDVISEVDLVDIIASLHNLLCEAVTGNRYNYMFHWANKCGSWCHDDIFDKDIWEGENK